MAKFDDGGRMAIMIVVVQMINDSSGEVIIVVSNISKQTYF